MVSPSKPQHSRVANHQQSRTKCKIIKGSKPLVNFRFYLDIEKHNVSSKIELKIKELGGSIEFFLAKEVTHFVTDKPFEQRDQNCPSPLLQTPTSHSQQQLTPKTPRTPQTPYTPYLFDLDDAISPNVAISNESKATNSKHRSRADAMLQRARNQTFESSSKVPSLSHSPVLLAKSWGTPIWTPEYTLKFLDKIKFALKVDYESTKTNAVTPQSHHRSNNSTRGANAKRLKGEYVKIETFQRNYRPYYQEFKVWPRVNLASAPGFCPFLVVDNRVGPVQAVAETPTRQPQTHGDNSKPKFDDVDNNNDTVTMTRKSRSKQMRTTKNDIKLSSEKQCGYCEICRTEYDVLATHLQSKEHVNFVKNADNFLALDTLITNSASVNSFLNVNKPDKVDIDSGLFGKRTTSKKVAKLFRTSDDKPDRHTLNEDAVKLNGATGHTLSPMCTRRSNSRRTESRVAVVAGKTPPKRSPVKAVPMDVDEDDDDDDDDDNDGNEEEEDDDDKDGEQEAQNDIAANDLEPISKLRSRRESAKRINYAEPKEDEDNSNDSKVQRIRMRGIRWRPPSVDSPSSVSQQPIVYKVVDPEIGARTARSNRSVANSRNESTTTESNNKTSTTGGIKVRICRVRESELSLLTNEADNFMFPRITSDQLTDDDRQSTPEPTDLSADIVSSEMGRSGTTAAATTASSAASAKVRNTSESSGRDLTASTNNKRTGRKQLEAFLKENSDFYKFDTPDARVRFQEAPFQSSLIRYASSCDTAVGGGAGASGSLGTRSTMITSQLSMSKASTIASATPSESEDGKGASKTFDKGKLLKSDIVKRHKFAFERIPSTEPWFEAFQRQDECRERIFEYWGSTAYRKLPFELGPLPPHAPDCCPLSKLTGNGKPHPKPKRNKAKNKKIMRPATVVNSNDEQHSQNHHNHYHHHHQPPPPAVHHHHQPSPEPVVVSCKHRVVSSPMLNTVNVGRLIDDPIITKRLHDEAAMQKRLMKIQKQLELQPVVQPSSSNTTTNSSSSSSSKCDLKRSSSVFFTSTSLPARVDVRPSVLTMKSETIEKKMHRRNLMKDFSPTSRQPSPTMGASNSIADRRGSHPLLDINGQPRKSPREHASTLAILSCIVQQQRKREKELNGGISPDKTLTGRDGSLDQTTDSEDCGDDDDAMTEAEPPPTNDSFQQQLRVAAVHVKQECESDNGVAERSVSRNSCPTDTSVGGGTTRAASAAAAAATGYTVSVCPPPSASKSSRFSVKDDVKGFPTIPIIDYQNPHKICQQIDQMLLASQPMTSDEGYSCSADDVDFTDIPIDGSSSCDDLILISTPKDLLDIVTSVTSGPLSYRSYVNLRKPTGLSSFVNRKRRNNRTGWPSVPKRRVIAAPIKHEIPLDVADDDNDSCNTEADDTVVVGTSVVIPPVDIITRHLTDDDFLINSQQSNDCLHDDHSRQSFVFTSSSEKAEHSDIFTVSSDSVDTADMTAAAAGHQSAPLHPCHASKVIVDSAMAATAAVAAASYVCKDAAAAAAAGITLAEMLKNQIGASVGENNANDDDNDDDDDDDEEHCDDDQEDIDENDDDVTDDDQSAASQKDDDKRSPTATSSPSSFLTGDQSSQTLQPIVRMRKINQQDLQRNIGAKQHCRATSSKPVLAAPKSQFSPPKLRKPRGRWYRER